MSDLLAFVCMSHRTVLLLIWPLTSAVSSDQLILDWQGHKIGKTQIGIQNIPNLFAATKTKSIQKFHTF